MHHRWECACLAAHCCDDGVLPGPALQHLHLFRVAEVAVSLHGMRRASGNPVLGLGLGAGRVPPPRWQVGGSVEREKALEMLSKEFQGVVKRARERGPSPSAVGCWALVADAGGATDERLEMPALDGDHSTKQALASCHVHSAKGLEVVQDGWQMPVNRCADETEDLKVLESDQRLDRSCDVAVEV